MFFEQVYDKSLAQASYVIGCQAGGVAAVIDPKRDVDTYLEIAKNNNLKITHILETHIHADFLCGSRELAALTGAELYLSDMGDKDWKYEFPHNKLRHGDHVKLGNLNFEVLHTPGHTPESISFLLTDKPASQEPVMLFTGDFVFVGDVGRPDLLEQAAGLKGTQEIGAAQMFDSLNQFQKLQDFIQVWPGHGAGSACGKSLGAVPLSTVGYEKIRNWALQLLDDRANFQKELLADQPEPPRYFAMMKKLNKIDRELFTEVPQIQNLSRESFQNAKSEGLKIIDVRTPEAFSGGFLEGSLNIPNTNNFSTWMGWYMDYEEYFVLIAEEAEVTDLTRKLMRIGLDNIKGFITPGQLADFEGGNLAKYSPIDKKEVKEKLKKGNVQVIDVRGASEFKQGHIDGAENIFVGKLDQHLDQVSKEKEVIIHCQSGGRAAIAYSLLRAEGFRNVVNYAGGWEDWSN
ncbi:hydroxyacylglutathione hydrolase [Cyclobacterium lianum]|uniref:Hydroxyacylglutathione hydrolase n=1 Tax=Cyclobacterium lianum TaxID=388280 RepID=A0A1M7P8H9_9BACT|nr:MBL fold metallo-hydrolase [Cyclobacterium lianum]SHN12735.1 hydroxyacylglutathione hydrolase [Cyclobacterium lianum]